MTKEESVKITNRLIDVVVSEKDITVHDLLFVSFAFCSAMVEGILNTIPDKSKIAAAKAGIKDVFIDKMAEYVDEFKPEEEYYKQK